MSLTNKRIAFVEEYLRCWNATEAARRVEYKHPNVQGPRLLVDVSIQTYIQARLGEIAMSANEVLARLTAIAQADSRDTIKALELIGKHHRLFVERHEVQADVTARLPEHLTDALSRGHDEEADPATD